LQMLLLLLLQLLLQVHLLLMLLMLLLLLPLHLLLQDLLLLLQLLLLLLHLPQLLQQRVRQLLLRLQRTLQVPLLLRLRWLHQHLELLLLWEGRRRHAGGGRLPSDWKQLRRSSLVLELLRPSQTRGRHATASLVVADVVARGAAARVVEVVTRPHIWPDPALPVDTCLP